MSKFKKHGMITLCICLCLAAGGCGRDAYAVSHVTGEDHGPQGSSHKARAHRSRMRHPGRRAQFREVIPCRMAG